MILFARGVWGLFLWVLVCKFKKFNFFFGGGGMEGQHIWTLFLGLLCMVFVFSITMYSFLDKFVFTISFNIASCIWGVCLYSIFFIIFLDQPASLIWIILNKSGIFQVLVLVRKFQVSGGPASEKLSSYMYYTGILCSVELSEI